LDHFSETLWANVFEEPFDVWSWEAFVSIEAEGGVFDKNGFLGLFEGNVGLLSGDFFRVALEFGNWIDKSVRSTFSVWKSN
jgi:hypothetical protein